MKTKKKIFVTLLAAGTALAAFAQTDSTESTKPKVKLSLNYNTGLNYYGRTDSLRSSGFFPLAEIWLSKNFYVSAAPVFVNNALQSFAYAGTVATAGYQNVSKKWITSLSVSKPFYTESSELVQSALKAQGNVGVSYLNRFVNLNLGGDAKYSDRMDFGASGGIDHLVRIENKDKSVIVFDPSFYVYAGSQNFQRSYYKKTGNGSLLFPRPSQQRVTEDVSRFSILAFEASVPVVYAKAGWTLVATPAYIVPQNLLSVADRPDLSERGEPMFYTTLTAKYTF